jgi:hypothetical protein
VPSLAIVPAICCWLPANRSTLCCKLASAAGISLSCCNSCFSCAKSSLSCCSSGEVVACGTAAVCSGERFPCRWNRPLFRLRIGQTMPYLGQCGAIATDGDMPIDL